MGFNSAFKGLIYPPPHLALKTSEICPEYAFFFLRIQWSVIPISENRKKSVTDREEFSTYTWVKKGESG